MRISVEQTGGAVPVPSLDGIDAVIGRAVFNAVQRHFRALDADRHREGHSRHFYGEAAKGTFDPNASGTDEGVSYTTALGGPSVVVNKLGIRQRIHGGEIVPVNSKMLAWGASDVPETWDNGPRSFANLKVRWGKDRSGRIRPLALAQDESGGRVTRTVSGTGKQKRVKWGAEHPTLGKVFFWLAYRVTQQPDPSVMPDVQVLEQEGIKAARIWFQEKGML